MAVLNSIISFLGATDIAAPGKMWHLLILNVFGFVADYGWRIVVFTVILKLVLSPLDFFQRYKMHKNQLITERLKPTMEKLQKQYGNDKNAFSQKQMELNRKEGYSYFSSCLPAIVTMVIFITLWLSMNTVGQYMTLKEYTTLYDGYNIAYNRVIDETAGDGAAAERIAQDVVFKMYYDGVDEQYVEELRKENGLSDKFKLQPSDKVRSSFLWVKNIWAPDVPWGSKAVLSWDAFYKAIDKYKKPERNGLSADDLAACLNEPTYNRVMGKLLSDDTQSRTNGYLILPILVVLLSVGSQLLSMYQQKRAGQVNAKGGAATSMKVMMFFMPVMMVIFALQYASIFTLYMVVNSAMTLFINLTSTGIVKLIDGRRRKRRYAVRSGSGASAVVSGKQSPIIHYVKGANPNAGARETEIAPTDVATSDSGSARSASKQDKKSKKSKREPATVGVKRSGRPDPNELMNYDMSSGSNKKK